MILKVDMQFYFNRNEQDAQLLNTVPKPKSD